MERNDDLIDLLNDLIKINNDRMTGYEKAIEDTNPSDSELKSLFKRMMEGSYENKQELIKEVQKNGGNSDAHDTTTSGKLHRMWIDLKSTFTGKDETSVLESCEFGEDAAQKAYHEALTSSVSMPEDTREIIRSQKASLKSSHDLIKKTRDMHKDTE